MERLLKVLALAVALAFLAGAVLSATSTAQAAAPARDAGAADASQTGAELILDEDVSYFSPSKSGPLPRPKRGDAGVEKRFMPATKSPGHFAIEPTPQQQAR